MQARQPHVAVTPKQVGAGRRRLIRLRWKERNLPQTLQNSVPVRNTTRLGLVLAGPLFCLLAALLPGSPAQALEPVKLQLKWHHQFQFAGYYAALQQGFYRDAGLDVQIIEGGPNIDVIDEV